MSEERNNLPTNWAVVSAQELFDIVGGGTPSTAVPEYWQGEIPWVTSADIDNRHKITPRRSISAQAIENSATNLVPSGSVIVVTRVGLGKVGLAETPLCFSQDSQALILPPGLLHPPYVLFYMGTAVSVFRYTGRGTTISGVTKKQLANLEFRLPPLAEQRRIVAEIEKQFTRLEAAVAALKRVQASLKRYRAAVLKAAVEGRLVPTEAELARAEGRSYEPADQLLERILAERRVRWEADQLAKFRASGKEPKDDKWKSKYEAPIPPDMDNLGALPEGWVWTTVEPLGIIGEQSVLTGPFGTTLGRADFVDSGVPILTIGCLEPSKISGEKAVAVSPGKARQLDRYRLREGDLLFSRMASVGRAGIVGAQFSGALFNYHLMRLRLSPAVVVPEFFMMYVHGSPQVVAYTREVNHGVTRPGINTEQLLAMPVALPPVAEQQRIVAEVERRLSVVDELEMQVDVNLKRAERLRQAILKRAFEGKLVPQDPDDEPASVLLERIRAEHQARAQAASRTKKGQAKHARAAAPAEG